MVEKTIGENKLRCQNIKLFTYGKRNFVFETDTFQLYEVEKSSYRKLSKRAKTKDLHQFTTDLDYSPVKAREFIPDEISVNLNVSHNCVFACKYCFAANYCRQDSDKEVMSDSVAQAAIDFFLKTCISLEVKNLRIIFLGGEPLLNFDLIKKVVPYAKNNAAIMGLGVRFSMVTNAFLIDDSKLQFMKDNNFQLGMSIDGKKGIHDKNRRLADGSETYEKILPKIKRAIPQCYSIAHTTVTKGNNLYNSYRHIETLGFEKLSLLLVMSTDLSISLDDADIAKIVRCERKIVRYAFTQMRNNQKHMHYSPIQRVLTPFISKNPQCHNSCFAGYRFFAVTITGDIYPCPNFIGEEGFLMGNIHSPGFDLEKSDVYRKFSELTVNDRGGCKSCWAKYLCGGGCYHDAFLYHKDITAKGEYCERFKKLSVTVLGELGITTEKSGRKNSD